MKTSKTVFALMLACFAGLLAVQGQSLRLTFSFEGDGLPMQADYVMAYNLTQDIGPLLILPGTSLVIGNPGEPAPGSADGFFMQSSGKLPAEDQSMISINVPSDDQVTITATDLLGRQHLLFSNTLGAGFHSFRFNPGGEKFLIINADWGSSRSSVKMIMPDVSGNESASVSYAGATENKAVSNAQAEVYLPFNTGDQLVFEGFLNDQSSIIESSPTASQNIVFTKPPPPANACQGVSSVTYGGKKYSTVAIGTQCWLKQNLAIGTKVTSVNTGVPHQETSNNGVIEKYCYDNNNTYCTVYGGLYNWDEIANYQNPPFTGHFQGICPAGWHIPTATEFETLSTFLGGNALAGGPLKETGTSHWYTPNTGATNTSGFTGLPAGYRNETGSFGGLRMGTSMWTVTETWQPAYNAFLIIDRMLKNNESTFTLWANYRSAGLSVRCLKDY